MAWSIETGEVGSIRWAQWVDVEAFSAWQWRLRDLYALPFVDHWGTARNDVMGPIIRRRLAARGVEATTRAIEVEANALLLGQFQYTRDVWECLANLLRALNQPAYACPSYVNAWVGMMGRNRYTPTGPWARRAEDFAQEWSQRVRETTRCEPMRDGGMVCELGHSTFPFPRLWLRENATVDDSRLLTIEAPAPPEGVDRRFPVDRDGRWLGAVFDGVYYADFDGLVGAEWWPGPLAADDRGIVNVLMSGRDSLQMAHSANIAGQLLRRSWREIVARSRVYCVAVNLETSRRFGGDVPEDIIAINAEYDLLRYTATGDEAMLNAYMGAVGTIAGALNPIAGALFTGAQAGIEALLDGVGRAVGRELDPFGRVEPVFQNWWIAGEVSEGARRPPAYRVDPAPPVNPDAYPVAFVPSELPSAVARRGLLLPGLVLPTLGGDGGGGGGPAPREALNPGSVAAGAARAWGVDPAQGL